MTYFAANSGGERVCIAEPKTTHTRLILKSLLAERVGFGLCRPPLDSATYRNQVAVVAISASVAAAHCPPLPGAAGGDAARGAAAKRTRIDIVYTESYRHCVDQEIAMAEPSVQERISINLRTDATSRDLIDRAAEALGKNRSEFMLEAARREATAVLLDQRLFQLDDAALRRFTAALDAPPAKNPRLQRLLRTRAPWER